MEGDTDLGAIPLNRAAAAERRDRPAEVLAEGDEEIVEFDPKGRREFFAKSPLGLIRGFSPHIAEPVRNPVDMGVDTDPRFFEGKGNDQIRGLPPHPF